MVFVSKFQSSMTMFHYKLPTRGCRVLTDGRTHPSSMTIFVHLFIWSVIKSYHSDTKYYMTMNIIFNVFFLSREKISRLGIKLSTTPFGFEYLSTIILWFRVISDQIRVFPRSTNYRLRSFGSFWLEEYFLKHLSGNVISLKS